MDYATMTKDELRTACKDVGIAYGKLNNEGMRAALVAAYTPEPNEWTDTYGVEHCPACGIHGGHHGHDGQVRLDPVGRRRSGRAQGRPRICDRPV